MFSYGKLIHYLKPYVPEGDWYPNAMNPGRIESKFSMLRLQSRLSQTQIHASSSNKHWSISNNIYRISSSISITNLVNRTVYPRGNIIRPIQVDIRLPGSRVACNIWLNSMSKPATTIAVSFPKHFKWIRRIATSTAIWYAIDVGIEWRLNCIFPLTCCARDSASFDWSNKCMLLFADGI